MVDLKQYNPFAVINDGVSIDKDSMRDKQKVMRTSQFNSFFFSIADTLKVIASVLTPVGIASVLPSVIENAGKMGVISAIGAAPTANLILAGISLGAAFMAVGASYVSSRFFHNASFDALEVNAQHTAKYLVKEIKKENACIAEQPAPVRADGKTWQEYVKSRTGGEQVTLH